MEIATIKTAIYTVLEEEHPATIRGLYYLLVSRGVIPKTEAAYKSAVVRPAGEMRKAGELPYGWLADNTRVMRKPRSYSGVDVLRQTAQLYRRSLWNDADAYIEVWSEKDAISGVLFDVTSTWDVPLMVTRGYPSITFLHSAAEAISYVEKPVFLYYFGDHDPSGVDISRHVEKEIRSMAPAAEVHFERVAVTEEQIGEYGLQTRPTKKSDSRSKGVRGRQRRRQTPSSRQPSGAWPRSDPRPRGRTPAGSACSRRGVRAGQPVRPGPPLGITMTSIYRVQYRERHWSSTTSTRSRTFAREGDARRFAAKIHSRGGVAVVAVATRSQWTTVDEVGR